MKNMKYLSLLAILGLLVGCTSDLTTEEVPQPPSVPEQKISHVVPVEQALEDLQGLLEAIDAPAEDGAVTRSGGIRRVKNVTTVSPEALSPGGTRSEATADVEDLLYIVNFENEAGYAILGADDRLEPVYAVVDEGSLTTEEFRYAVTVTPEQAEADGELVFPLQMVAQAAIGGVDTGGGGNGIVGGPITDIENIGGRKDNNLSVLTMNLGKPKNNQAFSSKPDGTKPNHIIIYAQLKMAKTVLPDVSR